MKIVVDQLIPFIGGVLEPYAEVVYIKGTDIRHEDIIDADELVMIWQRELKHDTDCYLIASKKFYDEVISKE